MTGHYNNDEEIKTVRAELRECRAEKADLRADRNAVARDMQIDIDRLRAEKAELVKALVLHDAIANDDISSGDDLLWTLRYQEAAEVTKAAIAKARGE